MNEANPLVIAHGGGCQDGWACHYVAMSVFGEWGADCIFANYGEAAPDVVGRRVLLLDFSYDVPTMLAIAKSCASLVWIDHHDDDLRHAVLDAMTEPVLKGNVQVRFNPKKCAARLTWEYLRAEEDPPFLLDVVQARDLWTWHVPFAREIDAWLKMQPRTFEMWDFIARNLERPWLEAGYHVGDRRIADEWHPTGLSEQAVDVGRGILAYQAEVVAAHVRQAREITLFGHRVLCVNATTLSSEIGHELARGRPFSVTYRDRPDGKRAWSLRSTHEGLDLRPLVAKMGGGGHEHAAGWESIAPLELPSCP